MKKKPLTLITVGLLAVSSLVLVLTARTDPADTKKEKNVTEAAKSRLVHVTVYPNSALVTREVQVPAGKGIVELVVSPLPEHTVTSSLYSESTKTIRVLTTRFRSRPVREDTREEVRKLEDEMKQLQQTARKIQADIEAATQNMALVGKLEGFTQASTTHATEKGKLDAESTIALAKYLMETRGEKTKEMVDLQEQLQLNQEQMQFAQRKLSELTAGTSKTERDAVIVVEKTEDVASTVKLNYLVEMASWSPQYKIRAGKDDTEAVQLEYLAAVSQQTGEDWQGVDLTLSTAQPMLNASPPDLKMLAVAIMNRNSQVAQTLNMPSFAGQGGMPNQPGQPQGQMPAKQQKVGPINPGGNTAEMLTRQAQQLRVQAQQEFNKRMTFNGNELSNYAATIEQARDLIVNPEGKFDPKAGFVSSQERNEGPSVIYHLDTRLTVPSRRDEQVIEVARIEMMPKYFYKAVPVLTSNVYRQADLTNRSDHVLLPGEATMYHGSDFVGRMNLPLVAIGEQFTVGFGAEPQLQVQRQMMQKKRTHQGGNQILDYEYRILVNSYKSEPVKLQIWDRLPNAENESLGVTLVTATPEISKDAMYLREDRPKQLLRWDLDVQPDTNGEKAMDVNYEFKLELARDMTIGTFESK